MDDKKSLLKEALIQYQEIKEAANALASKKLAEEFPEKFNKYLNEELNKKKDNESTEVDDINKESTKLDESLEKKEEEKMKNEKEVNEKTEKKEELKESEKETKKSDEKINESKTDKKEKVNETYENDEFNDIDLRAKEAGIDLEDVGDAEFDLDKIEQEIQAMDETATELEEKRDTDFAHKDSVSYGEKDGIAFSKKVEKLKSLIEELENEIQQEGMEEPTEPSSDGEQILTDDDLNSILDEINDVAGDDLPSDDMDEHHGHAWSTAQRQTAKLPQQGAEYRDSRKRYAMREGTEKLKNLMEANKKTTKSLNEERKKMKKMVELVEGYRNALKKYRDQLQSMSVFNTNLAHVNNILVNEDLALSIDDKINIIKEFKEIDSITESEKKYKKILSENQKGRKNQLKENLDEKISKKSTINASSKKTLDEVIEKTAYSNNEQINKIKKLSEYIEGRGQKKRL